MVYQTNLSNFYQNNLSSNLFEYSIPKFGTIQSTKSIIDDDFIIFKTVGELKKENLTINTSSTVGGFIIIVNLEDDVNYLDNTIKKSFIFRRGEVFVRYIGDYEGAMEFEEKTSLKSLTFLVRDKFLQKYLFDNFQDNHTLQNRCKSTVLTDIRQSIISPKLLHIAKEIYNSPLENNLAKLYIQSKAYEFIWEEFSEIAKVLLPDKKVLYQDKKLNKQDIRALNLAKKLIEEDKEFYTLDKLCKKVALNPFKLKYGFKKVFNITPGHMILDVKMQKAKKLLLTQEYNVSQVSRIIGYKHSSSFSSAFLKHFKVTPKSLL